MEDLEDKEPPALTKEQKAYLANIVYCGGQAPLHMSVYKKERVCRIDFIAAAHDPVDKRLYSSFGCNVFAIITDKNRLLDMIRGLGQAYRELNHV